MLTTTHLTHVHPANYPSESSQSRETDACGSKRNVILRHINIAITKLRKRSNIKASLLIMRKDTTTVSIAVVFVKVRMSRVRQVQAKCSVQTAAEMFETRVFGYFLLCFLNKYLLGEWCGGRRLWKE